MYASRCYHCIHCHKKHVLIKVSEQQNLDTLKDKPFTRVLVDLLRLCFLESMSMVLVGSEPMERKQIMGTLLLDSIHISSTFSITPSAYFTPMD